MLSHHAALEKDNRSGLSPMQHRHFATVAAIIASLHESGTMGRDDAAAVADHFAAELVKTNPKFDKRRFLAACKAGA